MFVTDDQTAKQSLLRAIHSGKFEMISPPDDVYWRQGQQSPATRAKILTEVDGVKNSPEMSRLLRMGTDDTQQTMSYHSVSLCFTTIQFRNLTFPNIICFRMVVVT